jgi:hypothetical protein
MARRQRTQVGLDFSGVDQGLQALGDKQVREDAVARLEKREAKTEELRIQKEERDRKTQEFNILQERIKTEKNPEALKLLVSRTNALSTDLFGPGTVNVDGERLANDAALLKQFQRDFVSFEALERDLGEKDPTVLQVFDTMKVKYGMFPEKVTQIEGALEPTALEIRQKESDIAVAGEGKLIEKRGAQRTKEIQQAADLAESARTAEQNRLNKLLDDAGVSGEQKNKILIGMSGGAGAGVEGALFPRDDDKLTQNVKFSTSFDPKTGEETQVPIEFFKDPKTGQLVHRVIPQFTPEAKAVAQPAGTAVPVAAPKPEPAVQELQSKLKLERQDPTIPTPVKRKETEGQVKLTDLKPVKGAPTLKEYIDFIASNPANVDAQGDITIPEAELVSDYQSILETQKLKNAAQGKQKSLRIR